jgi:hypothetical protein
LKAFRGKVDSLEKIFEKLFKNPLTDGTRCAIIIVSKGQGTLVRWLEVEPTESVKTSKNFSKTP